MTPVRKKAASSTPALPAEASGAEAAAEQGSTKSPAPARPRVVKHRRPKAKPLTSREMVDRVVELVAKREQPRSTVTMEGGPRGQVMPKVTLVTGEDPARVDAVVLKACSVIDFLVHRYNVVLPAAPDGNDS